MQKKIVGIRLTPDQEDRTMIHARHRGVEKLTTMAQEIYEAGLAMYDGMLREEEEEK